MTLSEQHREELFALFGLLFDEQLEEAGRDRLAELLGSSVEAQWLYVREVNLHASLAWDWGVLAGDGAETNAGAKGKGDVVDAAELCAADFVRAAESIETRELGGRSPWSYQDSAVSLGLNERREPRLDALSPSHPPVGSSPFVVVDVSAPTASSLGLFAPGGILFSYGISALLVALGLIVGWVRQIPRSIDDVTQQTADGRSVPLLPSANAEQNVQFVGRITGMADCRWTDMATEAFDNAYVPLGRRFALAAGLMEITYKNGPRVIIQGPATYEVDSPDGGYLAVGKLTARIDDRTADQTKWVATDKAAPSKRSLPIFAIRTPTATVADLGTEFGVEVDPTGASEAHVFRGKVELRLKDNNTQATRVISLNENESAWVKQAAENAKIVRRQSQPASFARRIPQRVPLQVHSTGVGLREGEADPRWQLVARSDDRDFKPRPAMVVGVNSMFRLPNDPAQSQWIAPGGELAPLPDEVIFTFRTTFDLRGMLPNTAVLRGRYLVDDHVIAIRLNGRPVELPKNADTISFFNYRDFEANKGFVDGVNVFEIDVLNGGYSNSSPTTRSFMTCRVELFGSVIPHWHQATTQDTQPAAVNGKEVRLGQ